MRTILLAFALLNAILMYSSNILHGNISNEKQAIPFATVRLLNAGDSTYIQGCATDSVGYYRMEVDSVGQYLLSCSRMGYETRVLPVTVEAGKESRVDVTLAESAVALDEVTVEGETMMRSQDRWLITPTSQQTKHSGTGYDLLYNLMIPGIDVDRINGKVSTPTGEATLYIDGVKSSFREVINLRPKDVERIEYFDIPYGKYAGDMASINIITKKYAYGGYVSVDGKQMFGYLHGDYNAVAKMVHKSTAFTLFAGTDVKEYRGGLKDKDDIITFPDEAIKRHYATDDARLKNNSQYAQLNVQNSNDKRILKASASFVRNYTPDNYLYETIAYSGITLDTVRNSFSNNMQRGMQYNANLYGEFKIKENQLFQATLLGSYADNEYQYDYKENGGSISTHTDEDFYTMMGDLNYSMEINELNAFSARLLHFHTISTSTYVGSTDSWQRLWTGETLFFAQYRHIFSPKTILYFNPGLSLLQYRLHGDETFRRVSPRLHLMLSQQFNSKQNLFLGFFIGNSFPQISSLNTVEQQVDFMQVRRGNPNLDHTTLYTLMADYNLNFRKISLYAGMEYYFNHNMLTDDYIAEGLFNQGGRLVQTYRTDANEQILKANVSATWKPSKNFNLQANGMYNFDRFEGGIDKSFNSISGNIKAIYYLKDFAFNVYYRTPTKTLSNLIETTAPASYGATVSYARGDFRAEVGTNNPFMRNAEYKYRYVNDKYRYDNTVRSKTASQTAYVKLAYTIDFGKKTSRDKNNVNRTIDSAILKAN